MRIIGGEARGRQIHVPKGCRVRPTTDRVKESLFDILHSVKGDDFLDMYAGSGNVGLEALSRGARRSVFIESDPRLVDAIRSNISLLGYDDRTQIITADVERGIGRLGKSGLRFDILFADPPYEEGVLAEIMRWIEGEGVIAENGILVLQHSVRETLQGSSGQKKMVVTDQRRYGDTMLTFLEKRCEE